MKNTNRKVEQRVQAGVFGSYLDFWFYLFCLLASQVTNLESLIKMFSKRKRKFNFQKKRTQL